MARDLVLIGAPSSAGSYAPGQDEAPAVLRARGLIEALSAACRAVTDHGDGPLQRWAPDRAHRRAQNVAAVVASVTAVAKSVGQALDDGADVLVIGGNCTIALGVMDALLQRDVDSGLFYLDRQFDLNTPSSTADGALDWMGLAHGLDLPGVVDEFAAAFHRRPLLTPSQLFLAGIDPELATPWEREAAERLELNWRSSDELAEQPRATALAALDSLPPGSLAVHLDVDVLDFIDAPLAENTDGRNSGPTLDAITQALAIACADPRFRVLSVGELNPARAAGEPAALDRFVAALASALSDPAVGVSG